MTTQQPPSIDGHLWVMRDGKIIDPHFKSYNIICMIRGVDVKKQVHIPASDIIQKVIIKKWTDFLEHICLKDWDNKADYCFINAIAEQQKNGGELVFGSMGWGDWIEYGGIDWNLRQF